MSPLFFINPLAIVFLPEIDARNGYNIIACNWEKEEFIKINPSGYKILKAIKDNPATTLHQLAKTLELEESKLEIFLNEVVGQHIVISKDGEE